MLMATALACMPSAGKPVHQDAVLMCVVAHASGELRKQAALALGAQSLRAAADAADASGAHLEAARLMWAACAGRGAACGAEARRALTSLKQLEAAGKGSLDSLALENLVRSPLGSSLPMNPSDELPFDEPSSFCRRCSPPSSSTWTAAWATARRSTRSRWLA